MTNKNKSRIPLREQAYQEIKQRILTCEFEPGEFLNESYLQDELSLGRSPINQALHRLAVEGLVMIYPRKGVMVSQLSLNEVIEMIEVRLVNECMSVRLATERAQASEIEAMREILSETPKAIEHRDLVALMKIDLRFHNAITAASRNKVLSDVLSGLHERQARFWFLSLSAKAQMTRAYEEHLEIIDAIASRDIQRAETAMTKHIETFRKNIVATI